MSSSSSYLMGYSDRERRRLALQASILKPLTQDFLSRAGLSTGMRVLDLGCGLGDVTAIAASLVGREGHVTGLDRDRRALAMARASLPEAEWTSISFEEGEISEYISKRSYDAVIGRHILLHAPDPRQVIRQAASHLRRGGVVAFQEYDLSRCIPSTPAKPLFEKQLELIGCVFSHVTQADIGMRLYQYFEEAGLIEVQSRGEFLLDGGAHSLFYEWLAETVRSLLPKAEALGICTEEEVAIDTLSARLKQEATTVGGSLTSPILIGTFGYRA